MTLDGSTTPKNRPRKGLVRRIIAGAAATGATVALLATGAAPASAAVYLGGVNMQDACNRQWPGFGTVATIVPPSDAYHWRCVTRWDSSTYQISVAQECRVQYGPSALAGLRDWRNPYSWYCWRY